MPEFTVKEVRLPELHLPEVKRDEIVRSLSGVRLPDVDLAKARAASARLPTVSVSGADLGRMVAAAAAIARLVRPAPKRASWLAGPFGRRSRSPIARIVQSRRRPSRWPFAVGALVIIGVAVWAVLRRPAVRNRLDATVRDARARFEALRSGTDGSAMELHEPVALTAPDMSAGEIEGLANATDDAGSPPATGEGPAESDGAAGATADTPAFEESSTPS